MDCGRQISYFNPFKLAHNCTKCGVKVCGRCIITSERGQLCRGCHFGDKRAGCFIATACYGIDSDEVKILQNWRDKTLLKNDYGKKFVGFYYKTSPTIAKFISNKPFFKKIVRKTLFPITELVK